ncbi:hypothetical protein PQS31_06310 [Luteimonas sp BLCC-B24]|uniref:hypothetical protein n=1 Tax=Luteimonas sp. BLCC-B24 TaxID=3025317 RepID=UPI00234D882A|nr:hypothetical protein [Luteimonas sp. BLCC-B24]MDC7806437.1 hypothetical protein [Luteimonas sp. BLCC-B24]
MDTNTHDQIRNAGDELVAWIANYDGNGRTYRQFWADHSIASGAFDALTRREDLPDDLHDLVCSVREFPILCGFEPAAIAGAPSIDELIVGKQRSQGAAS